MSDQTDTRNLAGEMPRLTKAQRTALWNLGCFPGRDGWQPAPHDGWRRAGHACSSLVVKGLAERQMNRRVTPAQPEYRLTERGYAARALILSAQPRTRGE